MSRNFGLARRGLSPGSESATNRNSPYPQVRGNRTEASASRIQKSRAQEEQRIQREVYMGGAPEAAEYMKPTSTKTHHRSGLPRAAQSTMRAIFPTRPNRTEPQFNPQKPLKAFQKKDEQLEKRLSEEEGLRRHIQAQEREILSCKEANECLHRKLEAACREKDDVTSLMDHQTEQLCFIKDELRRAEAQHETTRRLLEQRTIELNGTRVFMNQADSLSGAEVIAMVETLNCEILQGAAFIADSLDFSHGAHWNDEAGLAAREKAITALGKHLVGAVYSSRPRIDRDFDPTIVQIALQVCMVTCCSQIVRTWLIGRKDELLNEVYMGIYNKDNQVVAGRWRAMTRAQLTTDKDRDLVTTKLVDHLVSILVIAGCSQNDAHPSAFQARFKEKLSAVIKLVIRLRDAVGKDITSMDLKPYTIPPRTAFAPGDMDDTYAEERKTGASSNTKVGEMVAGTTELGLMMKVKGPESIQESTLLKPKVILYSALKGLSQG